ncbi:MAG TPA: glycosyltransferase N-terminal domain-containing protein, partial [Agriterribacter sp.]|nr:glycosyltransferase N-terminal domain-containing protein [Agriterribacter sp.]
MVTTFYNLFIAVYGFAMKLASQWNPKAKLWVNGRKGLFEQLQQTLKNLPHDNKPVIWMHCASLGEFEQGRPVLEGIRSRSPQSKVIITFFSPSGYEIRKNYRGADLVLYLPLDTPANARKLIQYINPALVLWVRYEFWLHYLQELKR